MPGQTELREPGGRSLEAGAWSPKLGGRSLEAGAWRRELGGGSLEPGAWSPEPGAWSPELGARSLELGAPELGARNGSWLLSRATSENVLWASPDGRPACSGRWWLPVEPYLVSPRVRIFAAPGFSARGLSRLASHSVPRPKGPQGARRANARTRRPSGAAQKNIFARATRAKVLARVLSCGAKRARL